MTFLQFRWGKPCLPSFVFVCLFLSLCPEHVPNTSRRDGLKDAETIGPAQKRVPNSPAADSPSNAQWFPPGIRGGATVSVAAGQEIYVRATERRWTCTTAGCVKYQGRWRRAPTARRSGALAMQPGTAVMWKSRLSGTRAGPPEGIRPSAQFSELSRPDQGSSRAAHSRMSAMVRSGRSSCT
jgi:hypothetical protein